MIVNTRIVTWTNAAIDEVDGIIPAGSIPCTPYSSGAYFPADQTTLIRCSATDRAGNIGDCTFTVIVGM